MGRVWIGSAACKECHAAIYDHWATTPMANVVRDPEAIVGDFADRDPLVDFRPDDVALVYNFQRPTGPLCDGCHSVHYDIATNTVAEWNVGCERCHGPGGEHAKSGAVEDIVDPARLVRSHTFRFVPPSETDRDHVPNACNVCHTDRTARWATDALVSWEGRSPWRVGM